MIIIPSLEYGVFLSCQPIIHITAYMTIANTPPIRLKPFPLNLSIKWKRELATIKIVSYPTNEI